MYPAADAGLKKVILADDQQPLNQEIQRGCDLALLPISVHGRDQMLRQIRKNANMSPMPFLVEYYHPKVLEAIEAWPVEILAEYAHLIDLLTEHGPDLRMPHSRAMGDGLFEVRPRGREGIGRALYCFALGRRIVVLHAFIKKTPKSPEKELSLARKRMKEVRNA